MERFLLCSIVTPHGATFEGKAKMVIAQSIYGEIGILPLHAPLISNLKIGELRLKFQDGSEESYAISGGYLHVLEDKVTVLAEAAEKTTEINIERAELARQRAEEEISQLKTKDKTATTRAEKDLEKAINRVQISRKYSK